MARIAPGNTPKFAYIVLTIISSLFLYLDIQYKTFTPTKNLFNSGLLTSNLLVKDIIFNPIVNIYNVTRSKIDLVNTNTFRRGHVSRFFVQKSCKMGKGRGFQKCHSEPENVSF